MESASPIPWLAKDHFWLFLRDGSAIYNYNGNIHQHVTIWRRELVIKLSFFMINTAVGSLNGTGQNLHLESEVRPLEAVVNHLKLKRFALFGFSQGGPVAIAYAIKYPRRVSHLILYDSYARGEGISTEEFKKSFSSLIRSAWGIGSKTLADIFLPGADVSTLKWFARLQREAATAEMAAKLLDLTYIS